MTGVPDTAAVEAIAAVICPGDYCEAHSECRDCVPEIWAIVERYVAAAVREQVASEREDELRDLWAKIHVDRSYDRAGTSAPDCWYAGVIHSERVIERALAFRPGSMSSDPREQARVAAPVAPTPAEPAGWETRTEIDHWSGDGTDRKPL